MNLLILSLCAFTDTDILYASGFVHRHTYDERHYWINWHLRSKKTSILMVLFQCLCPYSKVLLLRDSDIYIISCCLFVLFFSLRFFFVHLFRFFSFRQSDLKIIWKCICEHILPQFARVCVCLLYIHAGEITID